MDGAVHLHMSVLFTFANVKFSFDLIFCTSMQNVLVIMGTGDYR